MTHEHSGHYAGKRQGVQLNETIAAAIREKVSEQRITCAEAHDIATRLNVTPEDVGAAIDLLEVRITKCQLGLFQPEKPDLSDKITPEITSAINSSLVDGRLTCRSAWQIAAKCNVSRAVVGAACDSMNVKVSACQLGTFK